MKKRFSLMIALALVMSMLIGNTAFAAEAAQPTEINEQYARDGQNVTSQAKSALRKFIRDFEFAGNELANQNLAAMTEKVLSGSTVELKNSPDLYLMVSQGYSHVNPDGPISITKGTLNYNDLFRIKKDVYVVCLSGTDFGELNQTTGAITDLLVGFEFDNIYARNIKKVMLNNIPAGANVIVSGHSLGGMVAQQVIADKEIKKKFNIINTVCFGSPLINEFGREGTVKRLGDTSDIVPYLSVNTFSHVIWQTLGLNRENGGYSAVDLRFRAHNISYSRADVWGAYDVTGTKGGKKTLTVNFGTTKFFHSPVVITR